MSISISAEETPNRNLKVRAPGQRAARKKLISDGREEVRDLTNLVWCIVSQYNEFMRSLSPATRITVTHDLRYLHQSIEEARIFLDKKAVSETTCAKRAASKKIISDLFEETIYLVQFLSGIVHPYDVFMRSLARTGHFFLTRHELEELNGGMHPLRQSIEEARSVLDKYKWLV